VLGCLCVAAIGQVTVQGVVALRQMSIRSVVLMLGTDPPHDAAGHTNILLLGQGDQDHDGIDLTDTIMVASLDPSNTRSVVMLSVPRDLWLSDAGHVGDGRINTLYRDEKIYARRTQDLDPKAASQVAMRTVAMEIGERLGLEIHAVVKVDFSGFVQVVDELGGVDVDVPQAIIDTEYPGPNYSYQTFRMNEGLQHLDGETALKYARSRHSSSDFGRSARQQQLLTALTQKVQEQGLLRSPSTILSLLQILGEHVEMTLSTSELIGLARQASVIDASLNASYQLSDRSLEAAGFLYPPPRDAFQGASVLLPDGGREGWAQIRRFVDLTIRQRLPLEPHAIAIFNGGAATGQGRFLGQELTRYGLNVVEIANVERPKSTPPLERSILEAEDLTNPVTTTLSEALGVAPTTLAMPPQEAATGATLPTIRITLGKDYAYRSLHAALPALATPTSSSSAAAQP
jgi:LCP family protein required for cell wall assembly